MQCAECQQEIPTGQQAYVLRLDLFAHPEAPEASEEDLSRDHEAELARILEQLERMEPNEVAEEVDRVFERHIYTLCAACRARWHDHLRALDPRPALH